MTIIAQTPCEYIQGTLEWLELRRTKITATDAAVIMGVSKWKTKIHLYHEKVGGVNREVPNERMQRGLDLEPIARDLFTLKTGIRVYPKVVVTHWAMASLDGIDYTQKVLVEIKCPGEADHAIAVGGKIPNHYYPQLQHQMYVCNVDRMYYFSFDGIDGVIVEVIRDDSYIEKLIVEEFKFYTCIRDKIPPEPSEFDYIERNDFEWDEVASKWKKITEAIKQLEKEEDRLRKQLILLSGESNTKGSGISLCQIQRKGNIDYSKIPELKNLDLEQYRKESSTSWRITSI